jgi:hypothetical protein
MGGWGYAVLVFLDVLLRLCLLLYGYILYRMVPLVIQFGSVNVPKDLHVIFEEECPTLQWMYFWKGFPE